MKKLKSANEIRRKPLSAFAENLLRKYGIKEHDPRLGWVFDENALVTAVNGIHKRNISAGVNAPPRLNLIGA